MKHKVFNLTAHGIEELRDERDELIATRGEVSERIAVARGFGDLSENAEYSSARDLQSRNESRIKEIEEILANAQVIENARDNKVSLGEVVALEREDSAKTVEYRIVSAIEADPEENKISDKSPLGRALLHKQIGEEVVVKAPRGEIKYKIVGIQE